MINWVEEIWYDVKLSSEMISKPLKTDGITMILDENEKKMLIGHNHLLEDYNAIVEQVEQPADEQDEGIKEQKLMIITITRKKKKRQKSIEFAEQKLILKMLFTLDGLVYEEKKRKTFLGLTWLRVCKTSYWRKFS